MKNKLHLIMPMGGAGSRFFKNGYITPKPLIEINGRPFFYWATMSIAKYIDLKDITFVVLEEHIQNYQIDEAIKKYFPTAKIVTLPHVLNGAVLTCMEGVKQIEDDLPIIFNDCDHLFKCSLFNEYCLKNEDSKIAGALLTFNSHDPKYSFLKLDEHNNVTMTVEKEAISNHAICGAYYFQNKEIFLNNAKEYLEHCNYQEYYLSGVYNIMAAKGLVIKNFSTDYHLSFGTPEEYTEAQTHHEFEDLL